MSKNNSIISALGNAPGSLRVLVAPLDWGLGHATRCIPVICALQEAGHEVWLAGEGAQEKLLRGVFPGLAFLPLRGYRVKYGRSAAGTTWRIARQLPALRRQIKAENHWLRQMQEQHHFDLVISDNRFGLHHPGIRCIFITHQLWIIHPWGKWASQMMQRWNYRHIKKFSECWVPDETAAPGLAGMLSHPKQMPAIPVKYIGPLSRLQPQNVEVKRGHLFISLSGPEPQRSMLEDEVLKQIAHYPGSACIVRGLPNEKNLVPSTSTISIYNHLDTADYEKEMAIAETVISRSGYSTVMDIIAMRKKAVLIPTPGQTEQEYLAKHLEERGLAGRAVSFSEIMKAGFENLAI